MSRLYPYAGFHVEYKMSTVWGRDYLVGVLKALDSRKTFMGCLVLSSTGQVGLIMITTIDLGYFIFLLIISPEFVKLVYVFKESIVCLILCVFVVLFSLNVINFFYLNLYFCYLLNLDLDFSCFFLDTWKRPLSYLGYPWKIFF